MKVADLMRKPVRSILPDATVEEAADLMIRHKIGSLPVVEDVMVVQGIITEIDLLIEFQNLLGANDTGWRATVRVPDRDGEFSKLARAMLERGWGIMAMGSVRAPKQPDYWDIVLKVRRCTRDQLVAAVAEIPDQQLLDLRETTMYPDQSRPDDEG